MLQSLKRHLFFLAIFLVANIFYSYYYFHLLGGRLSKINLIFVILLGTAYTIWLNFSNKRQWEVLSYLLLTVYFFFLLANFAFFQVFNTFIELTPGAEGTLNLSMLKLLTDFVYLVPAPLYTVTLATFVFLVINKFHYFRGRRRANFSREFQAEFRRQPKTLVIIITTFIAINLLNLLFIKHWIDNPRDSWWNQQTQIFDLGVIGNFYQHLWPTAKATTTPTLTTGALNNLTTELQSIEQSSEPFEATKKIYGVLQNLSPTNRTTLERPTFTEKPNILIVQLESVPTWAIQNNPTPMPFLKNLIENNVTIPEYYATSCETINAEFTTLCSFWPNATEPISYSHLDNSFYCLPHVLRERDGYRSYFFHANVADFWRRDILVPKWGFDEWHFSPEYRKREYDGTVFEKALNTLKDSSMPFFAYFTTYTSHAPHNEDFMIYHRNEDKIDIQPFAGTINPEYADVEISTEEIRYYYGFLKAEDQALTELFEQLHVSGLDKNTIVLLHTDHKYYNFDSSDALKNFYQTNKLPFVIVFPNKLKGELQPLGSNLDIAPTILELIEQENYSKPENFLGSSLFDKNYRPMVYNKCLGNAYFLNSDRLIQGNTRTNQYQKLSGRSTTTPEESKLWQKLLTDLNNFSNTVLYEDKLGR